jgi:hypothetical protein
LTVIRGIVSKASNPSSTDDDSKGFYIGFEWVNTTSKVTYECIDATTSNAVWNISSNDNSTAILGSHGEVYMQNNTTNTVITTQNVAVKVLGTTTAGLSTSNVTVGQNRLTYVGLVSGNFKATASIGAKRGGAINFDASWFIAVNGVIQQKSKLQIQTNNGEGAISIQCILNLTTNDYVELWVENDSNTEDVLVEDFNMIIEAI